MRDLDREVRGLLRDMAEEAGALGELPRGIWRRAMVRRAATIVGAAAVTIALLVGGSMALGSMANRDGGLDLGPLPPANTFNNRPMPEDMKGRLIASGRVDDVDWWLAAYLDNERNLCTEFATARKEGSAGGGTSTDLKVTGSMGSGCGPFDPQKHPIGMSVSTGDPIPTASGHVPDEVERVELILEDGDRIEAQLFAAPDGFEYPVRFYVIVPYPRGEKRAVVAYDAEGTEVGREEIMGPDDRSKISTVAGPFQIDDGEYRGVPYTFEGSVERQDTPSGDILFYPCSMFHLGEGERYGGGGGCYFYIARNHEMGFSQNTFEQKPEIVAIHGGMTGRVDRVTVELDSGEVIEAEDFDVEDSDFRFFLAFADGGTTGRISGQLVGYRGSEEVERLDLCDPDLATLGGSCGS
jgi:hypothetical protein